MARFYGLRGSRLNWAVGIIAGLDFLLFGYDQGVMGGLLTLPVFLDQFPDINNLASSPDIINGANKSDRATYQGIAIASYNLGCLFGAIATIFIGNPLGRKKTIFIGSSIMIVGAILQASSFQLPQFIVGRIITGFGNGLNTSTVPTWQAETSKSHRRGQLIMVEGALITCGIMISYWFDYGMSFTAPNEIAWRLPIAFQIVFAIVILVAIMGLPESPRWLILKGREDEALEVLSALADTDPDDKLVQNEFKAIKDTVIESSKGSFKDLLATTRDREFHRVALAYVNQMFQQISGINLITYYAATLFSRIGLDDNLSRLLAACNGTEYFLASWIAVFTVEKVGRRKLMLFGAAGMSGTMAILAGTSAYSQGNTGVAITASVFLFVFNTFFAIGWLGMTWLYPAEIVPLRIRAPANAVSTTANWLFNFLVVMITPVSFQNIGYQTYIIFAVINAFMFPCVYFFYPETAYRSLEEMDSIFHKAHDDGPAKAPFSVVKISKEMPHRYGKKGELLIAYDETEEADTVRRRSSVATSGNGKAGVGAEEKDHV